MRRFMAGVAAVIMGVLFVGVPAQSASLPPQATQFAACATPLELVGTLGFEPWQSCLVKKYGGIEIRELNDIWLIVLPLLEDVIRAATYIAVGFIIWGGIKYIKSQGSPNETTDARNIIKNALLGLLWAILAIVVIEFIANGLISGTV